MILYSSLKALLVFARLQQQSPTQQARVNLLRYRLPYRNIIRGGGEGTRYQKKSPRRGTSGKTRGSILLLEL